MVNKKSRGSARTGLTQRNYQQFRQGRRFSEKKMGLVTKTARHSGIEFSKQKNEGKFAMFELKSVQNTAGQHSQGINLILFLCLVYLILIRVLAIVGRYCVHVYRIKITLDVPGLDITSMDSKELCELLLYGNSNLNVFENGMIIEATISFIEPESD